MRNLKRVLSLALALVMVLGMMVITTSAATYADEDEITQKEAVEVLSAIGVLQGDGTSFNPQGNLNRAGAAKLIAFMTMGDKADEYLSGSVATFTDVPADHWAAKYIAYCANLKIINGNGDGTFNPDGNISTVGFAKLVLGAAGIEGTYTGAGWEDNVKQAVEKNDLDVIAIDGSDITREEAAALMLAGLKWTDDTEIYGVYNGTTLIKTYDEAIDAYFAAEALGTGFSVSIIPAETYMLNSVYGVVFNEITARDTFGRPGIRYTDTKTAGQTINLFYADKAVATYVNEFNKDIFDAMKEANNDVDAFAGATILYNGFASAGVAAISDLYDGKTPINGMTVELYNLDNNPKTIERVVSIEKNFAVVSDVTLTEGKDAGSVTLTIYAWTDPTGLDVTYTDNLKTPYDTYDALCGYTKGTALIVGLDKNWHLGDALMSIEEPTAVEGTITKMNVATTTNSTTVTVDGKTYPMNQMFVGGKNLVAGAEGTLYLDANGCAIGWVTKRGPATQYAYVLDTAFDSDLFGTETVNYAKLLYTDGTIETVETKELYSTMETKVVEYKTVNGKVVLENPTSMMSASSIGKNQAALGTNTANSKTIYVVETPHASIPGKMVYNVYTGVSNVPALKNSDIYGVANQAGTAWNVIFAMNAEWVTTPNTAKNVVYLTTGTTLVKEVVSADKTLYYYEVAAIVNGEITTVKVAANSDKTAPVVTAGLYDALTYDNDGLVIGKTDKVDNTDQKIAIVTETGIDAKAADSIVKFGSTSYIYDDATVVYKVAPNGISLSSIGALKADGNDTIKGFTVNGVLSMVVVTSVNP